MTSAATVTISSINDAGVDEVYAIGLVAEDGTAYPASASGGSYSVSVPQGKYTAIYLAKGNDAAHYYYGTIEDTQVSGDVTLTFDLLAFSHSIAVDRVNSEGEKLKWPVGGDTSNANIGSSYELFVVHKGAAQVLMHSNFAAMEVCSTIHTNVQTSALSVSILSFIATVKGSVVLLQPVDFAKTGLRPAAGSGWHKVEGTFAQTPFYKAFLAHLNKLGKVNNKAMARFLVYIGGQWMASLSTSAFNSECRADSYELYVPADYSGPFDIWGSLSGNCYGNNACISSLFYRLDGNELKTVGVRTLMQPHYSDANGVMHSWGYPRFVRPTACGMYIEKKGGKSKKIIIK